LDSLPRFPNLVEPSLTDWYGEFEHLEHLFAEVGPKLSKVKVWHKYGFDIEDERGWIEFEDVLKALQPRTKILRELSLRLHGVANIINPNLPCSLPHFRALQILDVHAHTFSCGSDICFQEDVLASYLPPSIRQLTMPGRGVHLALTGVLDAFLAGRLPQLEKVEISDWSDGDLFDIFGFEQWREVERELTDVRQLAVDFRLAGVECVLHRVEDRGGYWDE
jgi:hypothetical protein